MLFFYRPALIAFALAFFAAPVVAAGVEPTTVCVKVEVRSWTKAADEIKLGSDAATDSDQTPLVMAPAFQENDPFAIDPARYLARMMRYEVTHEVGFMDVETNCSEHLDVELYPLRSGWTVFARYSGHAREEKVNHVQLDEFVSLAQRLSQALLRDQPISDTINRETVLRSDSEQHLRTIRGQGHFVVALGTELRFGNLMTGDGAANPAKEEPRLLTPLNLQIGYRGKYQAWGLDVFARGALGSEEVAPRRNTQGGHVDFDGSAAMGLHFLRYKNATGMTSFYWGGGMQFQLSRFSIIRPQSAESWGGEREELYTGGVDVDLVMGYEFMRASSVHFYLQGELHVPTYIIKSEVDAGGIDTYLPGGLVQLGMVF